MMALGCYADLQIIPYVCLDLTRYTILHIPCRFFSIIASFFYYLTSNNSYTPVEAIANYFTQIYCCLYKRMPIIFSTF